MKIFLTKEKQGNQMLVELGLSPSSCKLYSLFNRKCSTHFFKNICPWAPSDAAALYKEFFLSSQVAQLATLINMLIGELSKGDRQKIMTICTIDVHARDVVAKLIQQKVENAQAFLWLSQLRHRWDDQNSHCFANICDAQFKYSYEYLGNTPRLVITPLTDR